MHESFETHILLLQPHWNLNIDSISQMDSIVTTKAILAADRTEKLLFQHYYAKFLTFKYQNFQ